MRRAFLIARVTGIAGGAVALLALDLAAAPPFNGGRGLLILLSIILGGWVGDAWWRWKVRR